MKKYPYVKQDGYKDCGAASLLMIIKYYHGNLPIEEVRELTKTTKNGTTAYHLIKGAKKIGLDAKGIKCSFDDLIKEDIKLPCIVNLIINKSYFHFAVVYEINYKKKYIILADPASGIKKLSFDKFKKIYNEVIICFNAQRPLEVNYQENSFSLITKELIYNKKTLVNIIILSVFVILFSILGSFYTQFMIDAVTKTFSKSHLLFIFILFFSMAFFKILSTHFREKLLIVFNQKLDYSLTTKVFNHIVNLPYHYYHNHNTGEIISKINDLSIVRDTVSKLAISIFIDLPLILTVLIILLFFNSTLFLISIVILLLYTLIIIAFHHPLSTNVNKIQLQQELVNNQLVETIGGFESVKGINIETSRKNKFQNEYVSFLNRIYKTQNIYCLQKTLKETINTLGTLFVLLIGFMLVLDQKLSLGQLFSFTTLLNYFLTPIQNFIDLDLVIKESKNALKRVNNLLINHVDHGKIKLFKSDKIVFKNLKFGYDDELEIFYNFNLTISHNDKIMVVGPSGGGKSTVFKLLMKYYQAPAGTIYIGNVDINNICEETIRGNICYIGQHETLFNDTIYNNLKLDRVVTDNELLKVIKICELEEVINNYQLGLNQMIEENGFNLSGGQRQRLVLARSLLCHSKILIIDEGLSELDVNLERKILKNIFKTYQHKTIIVISHRNNNVDLFQHLIRIDKGHIQKELIKNVRYQCS